MIFFNTQPITFSQKATVAGFTLIESLIAIAILLITTVGPLTAAHRGLQSAVISEQRMVAVYLAQEAVEHFYYLRNNAALDQFKNGGVVSWDWVTDTGIIPNECRDSNEGCGYNPLLGSGGLTDCGSINGCLVYEDTDDSGVLYHHTSASGDPTLYTRKIVVTDVNSGNSLKVEVTVSWTTPRGPETVTAYGIITDIYDYL